MKLRGKNLRVIKRRSKQYLAALVTPKSLLVFLIAVLAVCLMIYNHALLTEVTGEINKYKGDLDKLNTDYVKMEAQVGSSMSDRAIAEYAENELGLKRMDKYQTEYIYLYQEDKIEIAAPEPAEEGGGTLSIHAAFDTVKEYLSGR